VPLSGIPLFKQKKKKKKKNRKNRLKKESIYYLQGQPLKKWIKREGKGD